MFPTVLRISYNKRLPAVLLLTLQTLMFTLYCQVQILVLYNLVGKSFKVFFKDLLNYLLVAYFFSRMIVETQVFFAWPTQYLDNINSLHSTVDSYYYYVCGCLFS